MSPRNISSNKKVSIRTAEDGDASIIAGYYYNIWLDMGLIIKSDRQSILKCLADCIRENIGRLNKNDIFVCEFDKKIAGAAFAYEGSCGQKYTDDILDYMREFGLDTSELILVCESKPGEYYIDTLFVDENYRGLGLGTIMLEHCCKVAADKNTSAVLNVDPQNKGANKLYKHMGFSFLEDRYLGNDKYYAMKHSLV